MAKVLHVITDIRGGGAQSILEQLITYSQRDSYGCEHEVISLINTDGAGDRLSALGVTVTGLGMKQSVPGPLTLIKLYRAIRRSRADVVQTWLYHADLIGGVLARLAGVKRVFWGVHHAKGGNLSGSTRLVVKALNLLSALLPRRIICCAQASVDSHKALGYAADKLVCVPNGVDLTHYRPAEEQSNEPARQTLPGVSSFSEDVFLFSSVARWHPDKDLPTLLQATALLAEDPDRNFHLLIAGTRLDQSNQELTDLIDRLVVKDHVSLLGRRDDINDLFNVVDANILSSNSEARPGVVAEAMASGTPCVVTDVGDAASMVADTGWVARCSDPRSLADAMAAAMDEQDVGLREKRGSACRRRANQEFDLGTMVRRYATQWQA